MLQLRARVALAAATLALLGFSSVTGVWANKTDPPVSADQPNPLADPAAFIKQLDDALDRADAAAIGALFTEDAVWDNGGPGGNCAVTGSCVGRAAIVQAAVKRGTLQDIRVVATQVSGDTIRDRIEVRAPNLPDARASGAERWIIDREFEIRDGKIARLHATFDTSDPQTARFVATRQARLAAQARTGMPSTGGGASTPWAGFSLLGLLALGGALVLGLGIGRRRASIE